MQHLLSWADWSDHDWHGLLERASALSAGGQRWEERVRGKSIGLVFFNPSLRTRASMELAAAQLGGHASILEPGQGSWAMEWRPDAVMDAAAAEHIVEGFGVLSRYFDVLGVRAFAAGDDYGINRDETVFNAILDASSVPVINLESAFYHPCQALADATTLNRHFGGNTVGRKFVLHWAYHPKALPMAVPNSTLLMAARLGMDVTVARPDGFELDPSVMATATSLADQSGGQVTESTDPGAACKGAEVIYAKAWGSATSWADPGQDEEWRKQNQHWRVGSNSMRNGSNAVFMHPLPVRRGIVVDPEVLESNAAIHLDQAENRIHAQKAILEHFWSL
jgi:N-acetylornithine carbamoyltransferase